MQIWQAIILGIIQGITEWFPISSSGHLVLFEHFLDVTMPVSFALMLHLGSLLVVLVVFRKYIWDLVKGIFLGKKDSFILLLKLFIASIPIALSGFFLRDILRANFSSLTVVGAGLLITSLFLFLSIYPKKKNKKFSFLTVILMGLGQALAIVPGISRSGSSISFGMFSGSKKEDIAPFAFLMFVPAIIGAFIIEYMDAGGIVLGLDVLIGTLTAVVFGFLSLKLLLKIISKGKFHRFGYYCFIVGLIVLIFSIV